MLAVVSRANPIIIMSISLILAKMTGLVIRGLNYLSKVINADQWSYSKYLALKL